MTVDSAHRRKHLPGEEAHVLVSVLEEDYRRDPLLRERIEQREERLQRLRNVEAVLGTGSVPIWSTIGSIVSRSKSLPTVRAP